MARNVKHAGKVSGSAQIVATKAGPTITCNDPINPLLKKGTSRGKDHGKTPANGVVREKVGPTINVNDPAIGSFPSKEAKIHSPVSDKQHGLPDSTGKVRTSDMTRLDASKIDTVAGGGEQGGGRKGYALKKSYEKKGSTLGRSHSFGTK